MHPTQEQVAVVEAAKKGKNLIIEARAGCAKTTSCVLMAEAINKPSLYVAFNKSIATEATSRFPATVTCQTVHSLAWRAIIKNKGSKYAHKLQTFYQLDDISVGAGQTPENTLAIRFEVSQAIKSFCQSKHLTLAEHFEASPKTLSLEEETIDLLGLTQTYWASMVDEKAKSKITPDIYLKLFQLSKPCLDFSVIFLDEAQDSNPAILDIVLNQTHAQIIIVGDSFQSIYAWNGAINALTQLPANFEKHYLTASFRFTQAIADKASKLISLGGNTKPIIGKATPEDYNSGGATRATLVRSNITMVDYLIAASEGGQKVYVLAELQELWDKLYHIGALWTKEKPRRPVKELVRYKNIGDLLLAAERQQEIQTLVNIANKLMRLGGIHRCITRMKSVLVTSPNLADYTLATAHKSKGLEWDEVTLDNDLLSVKAGQTAYDVLTTNQGLELLYVALTRAKFILHLPQHIEDVIEEQAQESLQLTAYKSRKCLVC